MAKSPKTASFVLLINVEGAYEGGFKPTKLVTAKGMPVRFDIPAAEVKLDAKGKLKETTPLGAALVGEQMRSATLAAASERHGG